MATLSRDAEELNQAVDAIYAATLDETQWTRALEHMTLLLGASGTCYVRAILSEDGAILPQIREYGLLGRNAQDFSDYERASRQDPRLELFQKMSPTDILTEYDFMDDHQIDDHPFYQEFMLPNDLRYTIGSAMPAGQNETIICAIMRSPDQGPPDGRELRLGKILACHLARSSEIERRIAGHATMERLLTNSLDLVPDGILIVSAGAGLIHANAQGRRMLGERTVISDLSGAVAPVHGPSRSSWRAMIGAAGTRQTDYLAAPIAMSLPDADRRRPWHATVMPVNQLQGRFALMDGVRDGAVLVVLSAPDHATATLPDRLAMLFDLTPAEARLAAALADGSTVNAYAETSGLSQHTVRWTLKRLMMKAESERQADLVRLFSTAAARWG